MNKAVSIFKHAQTMLQVVLYFLILVLGVAALFSIGCLLVVMAVAAVSSMVKLLIWIIGGGI